MNREDRISVPPYWATRYVLYRALSRQLSKPARPPAVKILLSRRRRENRG